MYYPRAGLYIVIYNELFIYNLRQVRHTQRGTGSLRSSGNDTEATEAWSLVFERVNREAFLGGGSLPNSDASLKVGIWLLIFREEPRLLASEVGD